MKLLTLIALLSIAGCDVVQLPDSETEDLQRGTGISVDLNYQNNGIIENTQFTCNRINGLEHKFMEFYDSNDKILFEVPIDSITYINITQ